MRKCNKCDNLLPEERFTGSQKGCNQCLEVARMWRVNNKERVKEKASLWEKNNREKRREIYKKNAEYYKSKSSLWVKNNRDKDRQKSRNRSARVRGAEGKFTSFEWKELCEKYDNKCLCCGEVKPLTADHVIPITKGGTNTIDNIQPLCRNCNSSKYTKEIDYRKEV